MLVTVTLPSTQTKVVEVNVSRCTTRAFILGLHLPESSRLLVRGNVVDARDDVTMRDAGVNSALARVSVLLPVVRVYIPTQNMTLYAEEGTVGDLKAFVRDATPASPPISRMGIVRSKTLLENDEVVRGGDDVWVVERFGTEASADDASVYVCIYPDREHVQIPYERNSFTLQELLGVTNIERAICAGRVLDLTLPLAVPNGSYVFVM